jgi:hypothetical protein
VKLQLELQQQLAPHQQQPSGGDDTAATPDTRLVAARLTTVKQPPQPSGSDAPSAAAAADEAAAGLEPADATAVADIVAAAVAAAVASSSSAATTPAAAMEGMEGSPSRAVSERCLSCNEEDASWHLVSRGGSVRAPSSTGRCSFEDAGAGSVSPFAPPSTTTDLSECGSEHGGTPRCVCAVCVWKQAVAGWLGGGCVRVNVSIQWLSRLPHHSRPCPLDGPCRDELAASILGHPVMMAAQQVDAAAAAAFDAPPDGGFDSISSSITLHPSAASSCVLEPPAAAAAAAPARDGDGGPAAPGGGDGAQHALQDASGAVPVVGAGEALSLLSGGLLQLAGAAQARASEGLEGLRDWIVESLAALVQVCAVRARGSV